MASVCPNMMFFVVRMYVYIVYMIEVNDGVGRRRVSV